MSSPRRRRSEEPRSCSPTNESSREGEPDLDDQLLALAEETLQQTVTKSEKVAG